MHDTKTRMGAVIRQTRENKKLTQSQLAERIDVSLRTVAAIENDKRNPTFEVLKRLVHELDISADQIFRPDEQPYTPEQEQLIREMFSRSEKEQKLITGTIRALLRGLEEAMK